MSGSGSNSRTEAPCSCHAVWLSRVVSPQRGIDSRARCQDVAPWYRKSATTRSMSGGTYLRVRERRRFGSLPRGHISARNRYRERSSCRRFLGITTERLYLDDLVGVRVAEGTGWPPGDSAPHRLDARRQHAAQTRRPATERRPKRPLRVAERRVCRPVVAFRRVCLVAVADSRVCCPCCARQGCLCSSPLQRWQGTARLSGRSS